MACGGNGPDGWSKVAAPIRSAAVPAARPITPMESKVKTVGENEPAGWSKVAAGAAAGAAQRGSGILPLSSPPPQRPETAIDTPEIHFHAPKTLSDVPKSISGAPKSISRPSKTVFGGPITVFGGPKVFSVSRKVFFVLRNRFPGRRKVFSMPRILFPRSANPFPMCRWRVAGGDHRISDAIPNPMMDAAVPLLSMNALFLDRVSDDGFLNRRGSPMNADVGREPLRRPDSERNRTRSREGAKNPWIQGWMPFEHRTGRGRIGPLVSAVSFAASRFRVSFQLFQMGSVGSGLRSPRGRVHGGSSSPEIICEHL